MEPKKRTRQVTANFCRPTKLEISINLEKYTLFSSNSEVTFTIEGTDHLDIIDQLLIAMGYFMTKYQGMVKLE